MKKAVFFIVSLFVLNYCGAGKKNLTKKEVKKTMEGAKKSADKSYPTVLKEKVPTMNEILRMNDQYQDVDIGMHFGKLTNEDKHFLAYLIKAADIIDDLFWDQSSKNGKKYRDILAKSKFEKDKQLYRYVMINYGIYDRLNGMKPFIGDKPKPKGATFYPEDMTKEEFEKWIKEHPEDKKAFLSNFTVIRRDKNGNLKAIPYSKFYEKRLKKAAHYLKEAAKLCDNESLKKFLIARAEAFLSNDYHKSDELWVDVKNSKFEVTIGPYEVYEDALFNYKASFETFITYTDPEVTARLAKVKSYLDEMEANLPVDKKYLKFKRGKGSPIFVVELLYSSGDALAGVQTLAYNLPNDEDVRAKKGSKKVLLKNVLEAKFENILKPIAKEVLVPELMPYLDKESYVYHTLLHEISHGMGPGKIELPDGTVTTVNLALKENYSSLEEAKADIVGLYNHLFLNDKGYFGENKDEKFKKIVSTFLAGFFRSVRFGAHEAHGKANLIIFNYLMEKGAYGYDKNKHRYFVNFDKVKDAVKSLSHDILTIQGEGNYQKAAEFIKKYARMSDNLKAMLANLNKIPVDIKPQYPVKHVVLDYLKEID